MKSKILFVILALSTLLCGSAHSQKYANDIVFLHGLNSSSYFWNLYLEDIRNEGYINVSAPSYSSSLRGGANAISVSLYSSLGNLNNAVLIGHSAGGLIARNLANLYDYIDETDNIKGVITIGTPNLGAGVVTSMKSGSYKEPVDHILNCANTTAEGTINALANITWPFLTYAFVLTSFVYDSIIDNLIENLKLNIDTFINQTYLNLPLVQDMDSTSNFINAVNSSTNQPFYAIAGAEDPWQLYRLIGTAAYNDDLSLIRSDGIIRQIQSFIISVINIHNCVYDGSKWVAILFPWVWATRQSIIPSRQNWEAFQRLIEIDIHTMWAEEIGAYHYEQKTVTIPIYDPNTNPDTGGIDAGYGSGGGSGQENPYTGPGTIIGYREEVRTLKINDEHDGLIGTSTALGTMAGNDNYTFILNGVNHLEMSYDESTRAQVLEIVERIRRSIKNYPGIGITK